ncbi:MAG: hypothetical protein J1E96_02185 [Ruminococcus sp.]|nr:hypothetical protein [Ruminococcus sp.]
MDNYEVREGYEEREISLKDLFNTFRRGFWYMVITAIIAAVIAYGYSSIFVSKTYTTEVKLYVDVTNSDNGVSAELSARNLASQLVSTYIEMLDTNSFYDALSDELDNKYSSSELSKMVKFNYDQDVKTELFTAKVTASSATEAKVIADCAAEIAPSVISDIRKDSAKLKIVDNPQVPANPSSPNVMKTTLMAFAAGFAIALIWIFVKEALDNRIKYTSELRELNNILVLSAIPDFGKLNFILGEDSNAEPAADSTDKEAK